MRRKFLRSEEGQAIVETALVLPFLLLLILGMIEFGWILNGQITITSAAREGARTAVVYESAPLAQNAVTSAVQQSAGASSLKNVTATTTFTESKAIVKVDAKITPIIGLFVNKDMDLHAKAEMRLE